MDNMHKVLETLLAVQSGIDSWIVPLLDVTILVVNLRIKLNNYPKL